MSRVPARTSRRIGRGLRGLSGRDLGGDALERVAGEDRSALVERTVNRGSSASKVVVVERRQVVVDEAERMDALERDRGGDRVVDLATRGEAGLEREDRAESLAAAEDRVAGGLVDRGREIPGGDRGLRARRRSDR